MRQIGVMKGEGRDKQGALKFTSHGAASGVNPFLAEAPGAYSSRSFSWFSVFSTIVMKNS